MKVIDSEPSPPAEQCGASDVPGDASERPGPRSDPPHFGQLGDGDWVLVVTNGMWLVGRAHGVRCSRPSSLSPVYEITPVQQLVQTASNAPPIIMNVGFRVGFPMDLVSIPSMAIPDGATIMPLRHLSSEDQKRILQNVDACEAGRAQRRAAQSGLLVARPGAVPRG